MSNPKYIHGDLVMCDGKICKVEEIKNNYLFKTKNYTLQFPNSNSYSVEEKDITSIPITPEILEKNGWKKQKRGNGYVGFSFKRNKFPTIHFQGIELLYVNVPSISSIFLRYVHDLQHLLFGLGLDSNIKL